MKSFKKVIPIFLFLFCVSFSLGQIKIHRNLRVEDGLAQSTVKSTLQDSRGYLWFGTDSGISRWDGIDFVNYQLSEGLIQQYVVNILELPDSSILAVSFDGVSRLKDNEFHNTSIGKESLYIESATIVNGQVWLATTNGIYKYENDKITRLQINEKVDTAVITSIFQSKNQDVYIPTREGNIYLLRNNELLTPDFNNELPKCTIKDIVEGRDGKLYFASFSGVFIVDGKFVSVLNKKNGLPSDDISALAEGNDGTIYIGTHGNGLILYNKGILESINSENGLLDNYVISLDIGNDGTVYIGTRAAGVFLYRNRQFITYDKTVGLADNFIMSISEDKYGNMYFGSMNAGVSILTNNGFRYLNNKNGLQTNDVSFMSKTQDGKVLIQNKHAVIVYDANGNQKIESYVYGEELPYMPRCMMQSKSGDIWIGTNQGLLLLKDGKVDDLKNDPRYISENIVSITETPDGELNIASSYMGLALFRDGKYKRITTDNGLVNNRVITTMMGRNGDLFVGTVQGLSIVRGDTVLNYDIRDGLSDNTIYGIIEDDEGKLYLTTNRGINVLNFEGGKPKIRVIRAVDGLASDELNGQACYKDKFGRLWFGTVKGVTCYDPSKDIPHSIPPKMHLTRARLLDNDIDVFGSSSKTFKYDENYLRFDFIGINISSPKNVIYQYHMEGLNDDWLETKLSSIQYTNLNDGDYKFEVRAMNEWGYWSEPASFEFTINPPLWETWPFIILATLMVLGIVAFLVTYRFRQLLAVERLRTKIAADLHDNIGASLTEISILGEVISKNIEHKNPSVLLGLEKISETSRNLVDKMSDIVWLVNPKRDSLYDLILRLKDSYSELLSYRGISFKAHNLKSLEKISLNMEHRQNLYLIFKEGINNSIKHSSCDEINIEANVRGKSLEMILQDNGIGFSENLSHGNGLGNMLERAKFIGGELKVESNKGTGTKIQFVGNIT
ncbi:MAG: hypothetical protein KKA84_12750 [Bacteroidetes bacterium]|nr:hypothetical protein [Bacteroidota bacterium]